jgi:hypothetical protein
MGCSVKVTLLPGEFSLLQFACQLFGLGTSKLMYVCDQLLIIISSSSMVASLIWVLDHQSFGRS